MGKSAHNSKLRAALDEANPGSVVAMVDGDAFKGAVARVPRALFELEESELRSRAKPTRTDYALRMAFWNEIRLAQTSGQPIQPNRIYGGICSYQHWWSSILQVPEKLAWLLCPLREYTESLEPLLGRIAERYDEILNLNIYDAKGKPDPAVIKLVLKAMESVEGRLLGAAVQRSENRSLSLQVRAQESELSMTDLQAKLRELDERDRRSQHLPDLTDDGI